MSAIPVVLTFLVIVLIATSGMVSVPERSQLVVARRGDKQRIRGPGLRFVWPSVESGHLVYTAPQPVSGSIVASSHDGVQVRVDWRAQLVISDPWKAWTTEATFPRGTVAAIGSVIAEFTQACPASSLLLGAGLLDPQLSEPTNRRLSSYGAVVEQLIITRTTLPQRSLELAHRYATRTLEHTLTLHDAELDMIRATAATASEIERLQRIAQLESLLTTQILEYERIRARTIAAHHGNRHVVVERDQLPPRGS